MDMQAAIRAVSGGRDLNAGEMGEAMRAIMSGQATQAQIGGFLVGLHMKGETVDEIAAAVRVMRELALSVDVDDPHLVDTCGTGGDASGTFNISTASALVAAATGAKVAKHGNRAMSGVVGSADLLAAAGVNLDRSPEQIAACIREVGVGFMFAPAHHSAMKHVVGPRRELGVRTIFNLLGPLSNPAGAPNQLIGVFADAWVEPLARVLQRLGSRHVIVVHSEDGLDEISIGAPTRIAELRNGEINTYTVAPEEFGFERHALDTVRVNSIEESLGVIRGVLANQPGPARDIVALNAGAAIFVAGLASSLNACVQKALAVIADGSAARVLERLAAFTHQE